MKIFKITDNIEIVCEWAKTRNGFKHTATLMINGKEQESVKINYLNRTWESYEYQSVLSKLIDKTTSLSDEDKEICMKFISKDHTDWSQFNATFMAAKVGELLTNTQKEKNDWQKRMLKAGLSLEMPADWETLSEDEKENRLNNVLKHLGKVGNDNAN